MNAVAGDGDFRIQIAAGSEREGLFGKYLFVRFVESCCVADHFKECLLSVEAEEVIAAVVAISKGEAAWAGIGFGCETHAKGIVGPKRVARDDHRMGVMLGGLAKGLIHNAVAVFFYDSPCPLGVNIPGEGRDDPIAPAGGFGEVVVFGSWANDAGEHSGIKAAEIIEKEGLLMLFPGRNDARSKAQNKQKRGQ